MLHALRRIHERDRFPKRKANCRGIKKTLAKQARDPTVAQNWDNNKTLKQNYQSMGIDMLKLSEHCNTMDRLPLAAPRRS